MTDPPSEPANPVAAFPETQGRAKGYDKQAVDAFLQRAKEAFDAGADGGATLTSGDVRAVAFPLVKGGYQIASVDAALGRIEDAFAALVNRSGEH